MTIRYITRILSEDGEVLLEDFDAQCEEGALATHEEFLALIESGDLAREAEVPQDATLTVQTYRTINDVVLAETRLEHNGEHYEETHTIGRW